MLSDLESFKGTTLPLSLLSGFLRPAFEEEEEDEDAICGLVLSQSETKHEIISGWVETT